MAEINEEFQSDHFSQKNVTDLFPYNKMHCTSTMKTKVCLMQLYRDSLNITNANTPTAQYGDNVALNNLTPDSDNIHKHSTSRVNPIPTKQYLQDDSLLDDLQLLMDAQGSTGTNGNNIVKLIRANGNISAFRLVNLLSSHKYVINGSRFRQTTKYKVSFIKRIQITYADAMKSIRSDSQDLLKEFVRSLTAKKKVILYFRVPNVNWISVLFSLQRFDKLASGKINGSMCAVYKAQFQSMTDYLMSYGINNNNATISLNYLTFPTLGLNSVAENNTILAVTEEWIDIYSSFSFTLLSGKNGTLAHPLLIRQFIYPNIKIARPLVSQVDPASVIQSRLTQIPALIPNAHQINLLMFSKAYSACVPSLPHLQTISLPPQYQQKPLYSYSSSSSYTTTTASIEPHLAGCFLKQWIVIYWITTVLNKYHRYNVHLMLDNKETMINKNHYQYLFGYLSIFNLNYYQIFQIFSTWANARAGNPPATKQPTTETTMHHNITRVVSAYQQTEKQAKDNNKKRKFAEINEDNGKQQDRPFKFVKLDHQIQSHPNKGADITPPIPTNINKEEQYFSNYNTGKSTVISSLFSLIYIKATHVITVDTLDMLYELFYPRRRQFRTSVSHNGQKEIHGVDQSHDTERVNTAKNLQMRYPQVSKIVKYLAGVKSVLEEGLHFFSLDTNAMAYTTFITIAKMDNRIAKLLNIKQKIREEEVLVGAVRTREEFEYENSNEYSVDNSSSLSKHEHSTVLFGSDYKFDPSKRKRAIESRLASNNTVDSRHPTTELQHINQWILDDYENYVKNESNTMYSTLHTQAQPSVVNMEPEQMLLELYSLCHESSPLTSQQKLKIVSGIWMHPSKEAIITPKDSPFIGDTTESNNKNSLKTIIDCYSFLSNNSTLFKKRSPEIPIAQANKTILNSHNIHVWIAAIELIFLYLPPVDVLPTASTINVQPFPSKEMDKIIHIEETAREDYQEHVMDGIAKLPFMNTSHSPKIYQSYFDFIVPSVKKQQEQGFGNYIINASESVAVVRKTQRVKQTDINNSGSKVTEMPSYPNQFTKINTFTMNTEKTLWDDETLMIYSITSYFFLSIPNPISGITHHSLKSGTANKKIVDNDSDLNMEESIDKEQKHPPDFGVDFSFLTQHFNKETLKNETEKCYSLFMDLIYSRWVKLLLKNKR